MQKPQALADDSGISDPFLRYELLDFEEIFRQGFVCL